MWTICLSAGAKGGKHNREKQDWLFSSQHHHHYYHHHHPCSSRRCTAISSTCRRTSSCTALPRLAASPTSTCGRWRSASAWLLASMSLCHPPMSHTRRASSSSVSSQRRGTPQSEWERGWLGGAVKGEGWRGWSCRLVDPLSSLIHENYQLLAVFCCSCGPLWLCSSRSEGLEDVLQGTLCS